MIVQQTRGLGSNNLAFKLTLIVLILSPVWLHGQNIIFDGTEDYVKVYKDQNVRIKVDTAFVVRKDRAGFINEKLQQLDEIASTYAIHKSVKLTLRSIEKDLLLLSKNLRNDSKFTNTELEGIVKEMDSALIELKRNNELLGGNNSLLKEKVTALSSTVKRLKRETKGIWWNTTIDKVVVFVIGIGTGIIVANSF